MSSTAQVLSIDDMQQLVDLLHHFLANFQEDDLRVCVPWNLAHADSVHEILYRERDAKPTASYDPERRILTVKARGGPLYTSISGFAYFTLMAHSMGGVFTKSELHYIIMGKSVQYLAWRRDWGKKRKGMWRKFPDATIFSKVWGRHGLDLYATIVFKVGFKSENWEDLHVDKEQWLVGGDEVKVVVLVNIKENEDALSATRATEASRCRIQSLLRNLGNPKGKALHMEVQGPDEDFAGNVDEVASEAGIHSKSDPDDWMGPLDVSMEVWERGPSGPQQRGNRTTDSTDPADPLLKITDFLPASYYENLQDFDASRNIRLDMDLYRAGLKRTRKELAYFRTLDFLRPWDN